jgi:hypothetical protein
MGRLSNLFLIYEYRATLSSFHDTPTYLAWDMASVANQKHIAWEAVRLRRQVGGLGVGDYVEGRCVEKLQVHMVYIHSWGNLMCVCVLVLTSYRSR